MNQFKTFLKKLIGPLVGLLLFAGTLYFLLILFEKHEVKKSVKASEGLKKQMMIVSDAQFFHKYRIFSAAPGSELNFKLTYNRELIYDQTYFSNDFLMRVPLAHKEKRKFHAIFAGCSFTWGEGLKPEDTFPWIFQESFKNVNAYNLGFPGGGLQLHLRYNELFDLTKAVKEEDGVFVYTFFQDQLDRYFARYNYLSWAVDAYPHYEIENNRPVYKGEIKDQPVFKKFMIFRKSGIEKSMIKTQDSNKWSNKELKDFALSIKELSRIYKSKFSKGEFFFVIHPKDIFEDRIRLRKYLESMEIKVLDPIEDYTLMLEREKKTIFDMQFPHDAHPNAAFNRFFGPWLVEAIKKADQNLK